MGPSTAGHAAHPRSWGDLAAVILVALAVRGLYIYQQRSAPDFGHPIVDAEFFDQWARAFAAGRQFTVDAYYRAPLYPWMLGTIYKFLGSNPLVPRAVQAILGALTCGLVFAIGRQAFDRTIALLAGMVAATYWILVHFTGELMTEGLATFLNTLLVWTLLKAHQRPDPAKWGAAGLVLGLTALTRPNVLLFAPFAAVWIAVLPGRCRAKALGSAAAFACCCAATILPVTIRNYVVGHDTVLISSQLGVNLYIGNHPHADGFSVIVPGTRSHWHATYLDQIAIAEEAEGRPLKPSEVSHYFARQAWAFVAGEPAAALGLLLKKVFYFWQAYELTNDKDIYQYTARYTPIVRYLPIGFGLIAPLGLVGIAVTARWRELFPLWSFVLIYMASVVLFFVSARFRVPLLPILILYAAAACVRLVRTAVAKQWGPLAAGSVVLGLLWVICNRGTRQQDTAESWDIVVAALLGEEGKTDEAIAQYESVIARHPDNYRAYRFLGNEYASKGDMSAALRCLQKSIELNPAYPEGHDDLGAILANAGRPDEALAHFRRSVELTPNNASAQRDLGQMLQLLGKPAEALPHLALAAKLEPGRADTLASLGSVTASLGETATAIRWLGESLAINPKQPEVYDQWARLLQADQRWAEAIDILQEGLRRLPDNSRLTVSLARVLLAASDPSIRDPVRAVGLIEGVCQRAAQPDLVTLYLLACAYEDAGRCADAVRTAREIMPSARTAGSQQVVDQLEALIMRCSAGDSSDSHP